MCISEEGDRVPKVMLRESYDQFSLDVVQSVCVSKQVLLRNKHCVVLVVL